MMRKLILWAFLGFMAILFVGPVIAAVATLLPFALLGFCIWLPVHLFHNGRRSRAWPYVERARQRCVRTAEAVGAASVSLVRDRCQAGVSIRSVVRRLGAFLVETLSGAGVGALLVLLAEPEHVPPGPLVVVGALVGGLVGVLVALSRLRATQPAGGCGSAG
jgi:hypothetical protein